MIPSGWASLLLVLALLAGVAVGWALCDWLTPDHCEDCPEGGGYGQVRQATISLGIVGEDRADEYSASRQEHAAEERTASLLLPGVQRVASDLDAFWDDTVSNLELHRMDVPRPDPTSLEVPGPGHHTGPLWLEAALMGIEARYPIPGTPQWEARHLEAVA